MIIKPFDRSNDITLNTDMGFAGRIIGKYSFTGNFFFQGISLTYFMSESDKTEERAEHNNVYLSLKLLIAYNYQQMYELMTNQNEAYLTNINKVLQNSLKQLKLTNAKGYEYINRIYHLVGSKMENPDRERVQALLEEQLLRFPVNVQTNLTKEQSDTVRQINQVRKISNKSENSAVQRMDVINSTELQNRTQFQNSAELQNSAGFKNRAINNDSDSIRMKISEKNSSEINNTESNNTVFRNIDIDNTGLNDTVFQNINNVTNAESNNSKITKPESTKPEGTKPEGTKPEGTKPDGTISKGNNSDGSNPEGNNPKIDNQKINATEIINTGSTDLDGIDLNGTKSKGYNPEDKNAEDNNSKRINNELHISETNSSEISSSVIDYSELNRKELNREELNKKEINSNEIINSEINNRELHISETNNSKVNSNGVNNSELINREIYKGELNNIEINNNEINSYEVNYTERNNPEIYKGEANNSELNNSKMNSSKMNSSEIHKTEVINNEILNNEILNNEILRNEKLNNEILNSEMLKSEIVKADRNQNEINDSEINYSDLQSTELIFRSDMTNSVENNTQIRNKEDSRQENSRTEIINKIISSSSVITSDIRDTENQNDEIRNDEIRNQEIRNQEIRNQEIRNDELRKEETSNLVTGNEESSNSDKVNLGTGNSASKNIEFENQEIRNQSIKDINSINPGMPSGVNAAQFSSIKAVNTRDVMILPEQELLLEEYFSQLSSISLKLRPQNQLITAPGQVKELEQNQPDILFNNNNILVNVLRKNNQVLSKEDKEGFNTIIRQLDITEEMKESVISEIEQNIMGSADYSLVFDRLGEAFKLETRKQFLQGILQKGVHIEEIKKFLDYISSASVLVLHKESLSDYIAELKPEISQNLWKRLPSEDRMHQEVMRKTAIKEWLDTASEMELVQLMNTFEKDNPKLYQDILEHKILEAKITPGVELSAIHTTRVNRQTIEDETLTRSILKEVKMLSDESFLKNATTHGSNNYIAKMVSNYRDITSFVDHKVLKEKLIRIISSGEEYENLDLFNIINQTYSNQKYFKEAFATEQEQIEDNPDTYNDISTTNKLVHLIKLADTEGLDGILQILKTSTKYQEMIATLILPENKLSSISLYQEKLQKQFIRKELKENLIKTILDSPDSMKRQVSMLVNKVLPGAASVSGINNTVAQQMESLETIHERYNITSIKKCRQRQSIRSYHTFLQEEMLHLISTGDTKDNVAIMNRLVEELPMEQLQEVFGEFPDGNLKSLDHNLSIYDTKQLVYLIRTADRTQLDKLVEVIGTSPSYQQKIEQVITEGKRRYQTETETVHEKKRNFESSIINNKLLIEKRQKLLDVSMLQRILEYKEESILPEEMNRNGFVEEHQEILQQNLLLQRSLLKENYDLGHDRKFITGESINKKDPNNAITDNELKYKENKSSDMREETVKKIVDEYIVQEAPQMNYSFTRNTETALNELKVHKSEIRKLKENIQIQSRVVEDMKKQMTVDQKASKLDINQITKDVMKKMEQQILVARLRKGLD